jgi:hypothetical protein
MLMTPLFAEERRKLGEDLRSCWSGDQQQLREVRGSERG